MAGNVFPPQQPSVLSQEEILERLKDRTRAEIARVLDIPSTRVTEMYNGRRRLHLDEARKLVEHYQLAEQSVARPSGLSEPVARLLVRWVALSLGADPEPEQLQELAIDLQEFSAFAARQADRLDPSLAEGFLEGRKTLAPTPAAHG